MHALVTGAGGFLGQALVRALSSRRARVRALVRRAEPALALPGVEVLLGDATDPAALARAVDGVEVVFHLAGVRRAAGQDEFFRVNVGATRLLLEACAGRAPRLRRFVLAGSRAASPPSALGCREDQPLQPSEAYGESKAEAERVAWQYRDQLPVAVARPPRIMGPGDRENLLFFRLASKGLALRFGVDPPLSWIDVDDCARGLLALAEHPAAVGQAFFLASEELTTVEGLFLAAAAALGVSPRRVRVPGPLLTAAAAAADLVTRATGRKLPLNRKLARQLLAPGWVCDPAKARTLLGFTAPTPLADSVGRAAAWYQAAGWL
ncbi:MAG: NAD-dependent epimerase/dehydratase family protein [Anaeromyxobacter sp.]|nr:NAD-dependent epimerase/dehydratase family protein [Anaeromyxobacter sp.]MBL0274513.1 NAD-dependent epimerase/dehydratase family protein [Anaeromyxobacter sp.]